MGRSQDLISEEEFNQQVASHNMGSPENDSPGDSESDAGEEFEMGLGFTPPSAILEEDDELSELDLDDEIPKMKMKKSVDDLPESARVINSEMPAPWNDREKSESTN